MERLCLPQKLASRFRRTRLYADCVPIRGACSVAAPGAPRHDAAVGKMKPLTAEPGK
jgi:hypothetical protein